MAPTAYSMIGARRLAKAASRHEFKTRRQKKMYAEALDAFTKPSSLDWLRAPEPTPNHVAGQKDAASSGTRTSTPKTPIGLVTLSAEQMLRICQQGISIELHPSREAKSFELQMRATLHCHGPAATRSLFDELFKPGTIRLPGWMEGIGGRAPNYFIVVGFFHLKYGDYVVHSITPTTAWYA